MERTGGLRLFQIEGREGSYTLVNAGPHTTLFRESVSGTTVGVPNTKVNELVRALPDEPGTPPSVAEAEVAEDAVTEAQAAERRPKGAK